MHVVVCCSLCIPYAYTVSHCLLTRLYQYRSVYYMCAGTACLPAQGSDCTAAYTMHMDCQRAAAVLGRTDGK